MYFSDLCMTPICVSFSIPKVCNFTHFQAPYTSRNVDVISIFIGCISASTDKLCPHSLRSGLLALGSGGQRFEEGSLFALCMFF